jgi:hypothetical protein
MCVKEIGLLQILLSTHLLTQLGGLGYLFKELADMHF